MIDDLPLPDGPTRTVKFVRSIADAKCSSSCIASEKHRYIFDKRI